jgi:hypothetical protein
MSTRRSLAPAAAAILLVGAGCGGSAAVSLQSAEATFAHEHVSFQSDWRSGSKNPYLTQPSKAPLASILPQRLIPHLRGAAWWQSARTFRTRELFVFDRSSEAEQLVAWERKGVEQGTIDAGKNVVLVAKNAVYFGDNVPAAHRAMATLRG